MFVRTRKLRNNISKSVNEDNNRVKYLNQEK